MNTSKKPVHEHLQELRSRLLFSLIPGAFAAIVVAFFYNPIIKFFLMPINQSVYFTSPAGGLNLIITLCLLCGIIFSLPFLLYQIIKFVEPAVMPLPKLKIFIVIIVSFILLLMGVSFAYFISLPAAIRFLTGFEFDKVKPLISVQEYFSFASYYIFGFGLIFQLPLIMLVINTFYRLRPKKLLSAQRAVIVVSFIIGAILTPTPDPINQTIMAAPIIILYYFSILLIVIVNKKLKNITFGFLKNA